MYILGKDEKISFEGEGTRIGFKTLFFKYPGVKLIKPEFYGGVWSMYVMSEKLDRYLLKFLANWAGQGKLITVETTKKIPDSYHANIPNALFFRVVNKFDDSLLLRPKEMLKIRVLKEKDLDRLIQVANQYSLAKKHHGKIMLMPEFKSKDLGKIMMSKRNDIHPFIRFMPPVQNLFNIS